MTEKARSKFPYRFQGYPDQDPPLSLRVWVAPENEIKMISIKHLTRENLDKRQIKRLYEDVRCDDYAFNMGRLIRGIMKSQCVLAAWDGDKLVGLIRAVGDGETILFIQDLLVSKPYQYQGIGEELLTRVIKSYRHVNKIVILGKEDPNLRKFYEKCGMKDIRKENLMAYMYAPKGTSFSP